ncbi:hypothetical protein [Rhodococcus sp. O3]|uniref:hypothetical protein n=1 Tax=Rhodococcus sp. O3 TaxID=3404919 RepID=UPI003B673F3B
MFKTELDRTKGPWKSIDDLGIAAAGYIDRFDLRRLHGEIGMIPPVEAEHSHCHPHIPAGTTGRDIESLCRTRGATVANAGPEPHGARRR